MAQAASRPLATMEKARVFPSLANLVSPLVAETNTQFQGLLAQCALGYLKRGSEFCLGII